jgi:hypothetical protein
MTSTVYPKDYFNNGGKVINRASCFVLMPFSKKFDPVYFAIKDALTLEPLSIECKRADDFRKSHIIETILNGISAAEYIIADLTAANANVFYELGLTHSVKDIETVIIIAQNMKFVPFDLRQFRCIIYEQSVQGLTQLKTELEKTFSEVASHSFRLKISENELSRFSKRLVGKGNFLYDMEFESPYIGFDAIKLQIHFTQMAADKSRTQIESQFLFLSEAEPSKKIENLPWKVTLIKTNEKEKNATISIDKE